MAQMPIEVAKIGEILRVDLENAVIFANSIQQEFVYIDLNKQRENYFSRLSFRQASVGELIDSIGQVRREIRGFHPYIIAFVDTALEGKNFSNLFGSKRAKEGIAVVTTHKVEEIVIPKGHMSAYFIYYLARYTLSFIVPTHRNHDGTRECLFDSKIMKTDILKSMKSHAICDDCRNTLLSKGEALSAKQLDAIDAMLAISGKLLTGNHLPTDEKTNSPNKGGGTNAIEALASIKVQLELDAQNRATRHLWIYLITLVILGFMLAWLTIKFSWDVMEPWTYFIGIFGTLGSYAYFAASHRELSPPAIYRQMVLRNINRNYRRFGFDVNKFKNLV